MFELKDLKLPLIGAPMAGGPTTPELVAAVSNAGGLGMLAAGYFDEKQLADAVAQTRALTKAPFGVNLFVPQEPMQDSVLASLDTYRTELQHFGDQYGLDMQSVEITIPEHFDALIGWLEFNPLPVVTFTFGLPSVGVVKRLQAVGTAVGVTVTSVADALSAQAAGANFLCIQGPDAGGHQSTFGVFEDANTIALPQLVRDIQNAVGLPLSAGGGVGSAQDVDALLSLGVHAVQIGSLLLLTDEAGTSQPHRNALRSGIRETRITRAFTGRPARAVVNEFVAELDAKAPAVYPHMHYLTAPLRAKAKDAGTWQHVNAWAGTGFENAQSKPAAEIIAELFPSY